MNIDYSGIITKANARKEALLVLTEKLDSVDEHAANLFDALDYFINLAPFAQAIDAEGQAMLGSIPARVADIAKKCTTLRLYLGNNSCSNYASMPGLLYCVNPDGSAK